MERRNGCYGQSSLEGERAEGEFVFTVPWTIGSSLGNRIEGREHWQRCGQAARIVWGRLWNFFLRAFIFPRKHEAKSTIMREGVGMGCCTFEQKH